MPIKTVLALFVGAPCLRTSGHLECAHGFEEGAAVRREHRDVVWRAFSFSGSLFVRVCFPSCSRHHCAARIHLLIRFIASEIFLAQLNCGSLWRGRAKRGVASYEVSQLCAWNLTFVIPFLSLRNATKALWRAWNRSRRQTAMVARVRNGRIKAIFCFR